MYPYVIYLLEGLSVIETYREKYRYQLRRGGPTCASNCRSSIHFFFNQKKFVRHRKKKICQHFYIYFYEKGPFTSHVTLLGGERFKNAS